jgi:hypothetical protein
VNAFLTDKIMKRILIVALCFGSYTLFSQDLSFSKPGKEFYQELPNPVKTDTHEWEKVRKPVNVSYASDNVRYEKEKVPAVSSGETWEATAWKGEKIHTQLLVWSTVNIQSVSFVLNDLKNKKGQKISKNCIEAAFVRYVMSDSFLEGCSQKNPKTHDSTLVADPIDIIKEIPVPANSVRPVWLSIKVPADVPAGKYYGSIIINADKKHVLKIALNVLDRILPPPGEWKYDLDLWQYPAPIARIHDVPLWSEEHYRIMRPYLTALANAGQKVITANIIEQPWGLTHVHFDDASLIKWIRHKNGTWTYDYTQFDRYISFAMSCGIKQRINCYSMITWDLSFIYFDGESGKNSTIVLKPGTDEYSAFWSGMIKDFTRHLKEKGWFGITAIAMDERPVESMKIVIDLLKKEDPAWKIALAGDTYHPEIENDIYDYCLASYLKFDDEVMKNRKALGKPTTYYTACPENHPNIYAFSPPAEGAFLGWYAAAKGYTGYLWWAYNTWVKNPLLDARWRRYPAGSLFQFYPGPRSSIRFEKLIEGIQASEKIRILREQFIKEGNSEKLNELERMLSPFELGKLETIPAAQIVENATLILNKF